MNKTKIIIDSDVIIHFIKGDSLPILHEIFPTYQYVILDIVLNEELRKNTVTRDYLDRYLTLFDHIKVEKWQPDYQLMKEFATLKKKYGLGESASMAYCKYHNDVIASSNITEITDYCDKNDIVYVTTLDFLWQAYQTGKMTQQECDDFISKVKQKGSKLPADLNSIIDFPQKSYFRVPLL